MAADNPFLALEKMTSSWIVTNLEIFAKMREAAVEATFLECLRVARAAGGGRGEGRAKRKPSASRSDANAETRSRGTCGRYELAAASSEASLRALLYVLRGGGALMGASSMHRMSFRAPPPKTSACPCRK